MIPQAYSYISNETHHTFSAVFCQDLFRDDDYLFVYAGFVRQNFLMLNQEQIENLRTTIKNLVNEKTRIIFDCSGEGIGEPMLRVLHRIVDNNLIHSNVYYLTTSLNIEEIYNRMIERYKITDRINVRSIQVWDHFIKDRVTYEKPYEVKEKEKIFLCFNRVARYHRMTLLGLMLNKDLVDKAYYSYLHSTHAPIDTIESHLNGISRHYSPDTFAIVKEEIEKNRDRIPLRLNIPPDENATYIKESDHTYFENSYFSLVTETLFSEADNSVFFSEKIFKPIVMKHPFMIVGAPYSLEYLKAMGYRTFDKIIDERYDKINNHEERLKAIVAEVDRISKNTLGQWIEWQNGAKEVVEHNYRVLKSKKIGS